ncbi:DUF4376 domain-containing protein [Pseudochrobactrum algeriensis]|uniref:DUF4376 domain-containing protein n=1 Tax=Pseudochrobactrum algeriensis TaxID=2834768 RepID=UPI001BCBB3E1|nr:DUF4376 domain-containing protein [Pseudochrobactrum algeriensis]QVQ37789.1 DUF4376 domain-containing protein [Pseudochrobactrum algeriensis]QVQ41010.1 DUF4376 domain-containing protein [Pseudochrobactrum algeriensis]QVQ44934.1 DUF4376 domain-containing protein [Pseudochrobactrum algeriensis]
MNITSAKFTEQGSIIATIDDQVMTVPDDMGNRHRVMIAEWESAGNAIEPYTEPAPDLVEHAAQKRWEKEVGGITLSGLVIYTDDRSKIMISGARVAAEADPNFTTQWKGADGTFVTLDAAMIVAISNAVSTHVLNCFALEAQVLAQIEAGTITTAAEIDAAILAMGD